MPLAHATTQLAVLDHGFICLRNISGPTRRLTAEDGTRRMFDADDTDAANSARMSFDQTDSGRTREMDMKLSSYLMRHRHTTPFEMVEVWMEMKMPIFLARQFVRHRTATINEVSGRYVKLPAEWYIPDVVGASTPDKKQGREDNLKPIHQDWFRKQLQRHCARGYADYEEAIARGVAHEQARMLLSLNHYTHWIWKQDLHNLMHLVSLRDHGKAQSEAQAYGKAIKTLLTQHLPGTMALYEEHRKQKED